MSYRELTMIEIKEVLRRWSAQQSLHQIARETGLDRKTVRRYVQAAESLSLERASELDDACVHAVAERVQARTLPARTAEWAEITEHRARIEEWLGRRRPLRLRRIHTLLVRDCGLKGSYDTLRRFAIEELGWSKRPPTVRVDDPPPGQEAQVDFGYMAELVESDSGKKKRLHVLIVTLSFSRYQFVWPTFSQTTEAVCEGLDEAWRFFGGMPKTIVPDNMKAIVAAPDALSPVLADAFIDYVQARGVFVDPARVRSPKDKPRVENQVAFVRESWFDGEHFDGLEDMRKSAEIWCRDIAGRRIHGTTRKIPAQVFEEFEKPALLPAPSGRFDVPLWTDAKVHPDHHIQVARALYSVPTRYLRKQVRARADKKIVKIYFGTELIKVHPRQPPGGRSTDPHDYPIGKATYALRSVNALLASAREKGVHIGAFAEHLLSGPLPWSRMRQAYALLRLCDKYGVGRVEAVCQSALGFGVVDVVRITRMLKSAARPPLADGTRGKVVSITAAPRFARSIEHFATRSGKEGER
jgi:transposase